jgi:polysaccharide pyruvyl transferase WcaK-like protein
MRQENTRTVREPGSAELMKKIGLRATGLNKINM